jgi:hypothetical protein
LAQELEGLPLSLVIAQPEVYVEAGGFGITFVGSGIKLANSLGVVT